MRCFGNDSNKKIGTMLCITKVLKMLKKVCDDCYIIEGMSILLKEKIDVNQSFEQINCSIQRYHD